MSSVKRLLVNRVSIATLSLLVLVSVLVIVMSIRSESPTQQLMNDVLGKSVATLKMSRMALLESTSLDVKALAQASVVNQVDIIAQLKSIARSKNLNADAEDSLLDEVEKNYLQQHSGASFDKLYLSMVLEKQVNMIALIQNAEQSPNSDLQALVVNELSKVKHDLQETQLLAQRRHHQVPDAVHVAQD